MHGGWLKLLLFCCCCCFAASLRSILRVRDIIKKSVEATRLGARALRPPSALLKKKKTRRGDEATTGEAAAIIMIRNSRHKLSLCADEEDEERIRSIAIPVVVVPDSDERAIVSAAIASDHDMLVEMKFDANPNTCPICSDRYCIGDDVVRLEGGCGHAFHFNCLKEWMNAHNNCPMCRREYSVASAPPAPVRYAQAFALARAADAVGGAAASTATAVNNSATTAGTAAGTAPRRENDDDEATA